MSVDAELPVGSELLGYRIEAVLGRGGMGIVYLAEDLRLKRKVALKLLSPALAEDERFRERLLAESELAASLDHPNIVPIYQAGEAEGQIFISMRYVEGEDLKRVLSKGPLSPEYALALVSQVASALDAAHARGLVHRDVKPSNVLLAPAAGHEGADHVYLADFGLTQRLVQRELSTEQGQLMGTVDYVAPEQIRGEAVDGRADVYSLACLLFECLAGEPPFRHKSDVALLFAHLREEPPSLTALRPELPDETDSVIAKALAKEPEARHKTCRQLIEAAREALGISHPAPALTRRRLLVAGGVGALGIAAAAAVPSLLLTGGRKRSTPILPLIGNSLVRIDTATNKLAEAISAGKDPERLAVSERAVWVIDAASGSLWRIDPRRHRGSRVAGVGEPGAPRALVAGGGFTWIGYSVERVSIRRYHQRTQSFAKAVSGLDWGGNVPLAVGDGAVWFAGTRVGGPIELMRISFSTGKILETIPLRQYDPLTSITGLAVDDRAAWLAAVNPPLVLRVDLAARRVAASTELGFLPGEIAADKSGAWVVDRDADAIVRIDRATSRRAETVTVGRLPEQIAVGAGAVWVANTRDSTVSRVDPKSIDVRTIDVGGTPEDLAVGSGGVWVTVRV